MQTTMSCGILLLGLPTRANAQNWFITGDEQYARRRGYYAASFSVDPSDLSSNIEGY